MESGSPTYFFIESYKTEFDRAWVDKLICLDMAFVDSIRRFSLNYNHAENALVLISSYLSVYLSVQPADKLLNLGWLICSLSEIFLIIGLNLHVDEAHQ